MPLRLPLPLLLGVPAVLVLLIIVLILGPCSDDDDDTDTSTGLRSSDYATGIPSPAGLSFGVDGLLIASLGTGQADGAVYLSRSKSGESKASEVRKLVERLPSAPAPQPALPFLPLIGPTVAVGEDQSLAIVVSGDRDPGGRIFRAPLQAGAASEVAADLAAFWRRESEGAAVASAPFGAVRAPDGSLFVADARAGAVLRVTNRGVVSVHIRFEPIAPPEGEAFATLPSSVALGPDGALYVTLFSGTPYQAGRSRIYRLQDRNGDGDAGDGGERTIVADALSFCIGMAFGPDGRLYALEYTASLDGRSPGRLWRLGDASSELLADDLVTPMALAIDGQGNVYISERDTGKVRLFRDLAPPPKQPRR